MVSKYILRTNTLARAPEQTISGDEYSELAQARQTLAAAFAIEEKYEILIANYLAFERTLLGQTAEDMVRRSLDYRDFFDSGIPLTVCMVNILTAARLYLDQAPQDIRKCLNGDAEAKKSFRAKCTVEHDAHFAYRFMEELRNHVQHQGLPISLFRYSCDWTEGRERLEQRLNVFARKDDLASSDFKKKVLNEIVDDVDLKATTRRYIESLSSIHSWARDHISERVSSARSTIEAAHAAYRSAGSDSVLGLMAIAVADDKVTWESSVPLLLEWDDLRVRLVQRNAKLVNLSKRYATSS